MTSKLRIFLASWWLTAALLLAFCAAYLSFTFGDAPYAQWVRFLPHKPLGLCLYIGLIVNLLAAAIRVVRNALTAPVASQETIRSMDAWATVATDKQALQKTAAWMKNKGFHGVIEGQAVRSTQGRFSFLPGTVFRAGLVVLLISMLASVSERRTETVTLHEGEAAAAFGKFLTLRGLNAHLPVDFLQVGEEGSFVLEDVSAALTAQGTTYAVTPGLPTRVQGLFVRLVHLGYAQPFEGTIDGKAFTRSVDLDILPPGKTQIVALTPVESFFTVSLEPEKTISKGLLKGKQYNLAAPYYRVVIQSGKIKSGTSAVTIKPGGLSPGKGATLSLGKSGLFARFQVVSDPALVFIYLGVLLTLSGAVLMTSRFFWFRKELMAFHGNSALSIGYREEYFKKWGIQRFHLWKEELIALLSAETKPQHHLSGPDQ